jgi:methionyl aminopeptidase
MPNLPRRSYSRRCFRTSGKSYLRAKEVIKLVTIKSQKEIEKMKEACKITAFVYEEIEKYIKPGITTMELDHFAERLIYEKGGIPAQKGYPSGQKGVPAFPGTLCISINDEIIHGIPSNKIIIKDGDIVSIDLVVYKNGFHGDAARTYIVGNKTAEKQKLVEITKQAFFEGIKYAVKGNRIGDISHAIGEFVQKNGYNVVKEFQGHGIGEEMHEDPGIPNYGKAGRGIRLEPGMTLAMEPMVMAGKSDICVLDDGWTIITEDGSLAAHYENTILITEKEPEILTLL